MTDMLILLTSKLNSLAEKYKNKDLEVAYFKQSWSAFLQGDHNLAIKKREELELLENARDCIRSEFYKVKKAILKHEHDSFLKRLDQK